MNQDIDSSLRFLQELSFTNVAYLITHSTSRVQMQAKHFGDQREGQTRPDQTSPGLKPTPDQTRQDSAYHHPTPKAKMVREPLVCTFQSFRTKSAYPY